MQRTNSRFNGKTVYSLDKICPFCGNGLLTTESEDEKETITVKAENVITNYDRRFISDELLEKIAQVLSTYMNYQQYDSDKDGVIDKAKLAENVKSIEWDEIQNKPEINLDGINKAIEKAHEHTDLSAINKISQSNGSPTWNSQDWPYPTKNNNILPLNQLAYRNIIITNNVNYANASVGDIWFQVKDSDINLSDAIVDAVNIKIADNKWASISINDLMTRAVNLITPTIYDIVEQTQITDHEQLGNLQGGTSNEHYHLTKEEYDKVKELIANSN